MDENKEVVYVDGYQPDAKAPEATTVILHGASLAVLWSRLMRVCENNPARAFDKITESANAFVAFGVGETNRRDELLDTAREQRAYNKAKNALDTLFGQKRWVVGADGKPNGAFTPAYLNALSILEHDRERGRFKPSKL